MSDKPNRERLEPELGQDLLDILPDRGLGGERDPLPPRPLPRKKKRGGFLMWFVLFFVASSGAVGTWWWAVKSAKTSSTQADVPMVKADERPYKSKPNEPGGVDVPDQDKSVYDRMSGSGEAGKAPVERLLPGPEAPQAPPALAAPPPVAGTAMQEPPPSLPDMPKGPVTESPKAVAPSMNAAAPPTPAPVEPPMVDEKPAAKTPAKKSAKAEPAPAPASKAAAPKASANGTWLVQLVAVKDDAAANHEWGRIQKANGDLLGGLSLDVQKIDLPGKGIYYRVRAGSLESKEAAKDLCGKLEARKQGCIVVHK